MIGHKYIKQGATCLACRNGLYKKHVMKHVLSSTPVVDALNATFYICEKCGNIQMFSDVPYLEKKPEKKKKKKTK